MIDYQIWSHRATRGLYMQLRAGNFAVRTPSAPAIWVSEAAFGLLEPTIAAACPEFGRPYSHWGATFVGGESWTSVLEFWDEIKAALQVASSADEVPHIGYLSTAVEEEFRQDFGESKIRLAELISQMSDWLRTVLADFKGVSILGI